MNTKLKRFLSTVLVSTSIVVPNVVNAEVNQKYTTGSANYSLDKTDASSKEIKVYLNGEQLEFDVPPVEINGRTKVPFRKIFESMGTVVWFNESDNSILGITRNGDVITHKVGTNTAIINGEQKTFDSISEVINDRTLIPVRMVADLLGADVSWIEENNEVQINKEIKTNEYHAAIKKVLEHSLDQNFNPENFKRYMKYQATHGNMDITQVILDVNMDLDKELVKSNMKTDITAIINGEEITDIPFLQAKEEDVKIVKDLNSNTMLVNDFNKLPEDYKPDNMISVSEINKNNIDYYGAITGAFKDCYLKDTLYNDYMEMNQAFQEYTGKSYGIVDPEGYKTSKDIKDKIRLDYWQIKDMWPLTEDEILYYVAATSIDELQTGLAFRFNTLGVFPYDINEYRRNLGYQLTESEEYFVNLADTRYDWIIENGYKYGFIQRYPEGKENITRRIKRKDHFRYVGKEVAKIMHDENLCLEEYVAKYENQSGYATTEDSVKKLLLKY